MTDRACPFCSAPLVQRPGEAKTDFRRRETCGQTCASKLGHRRQIAKAKTCFCGESLARDARGRWQRTCGREECNDAKSRLDRKPTVHVVHWPRVTGEIVADFSPHNITPRDGGPLRLIRPDDIGRSITGCSSAFMARDE